MPANQEGFLKGKRAVVTGATRGIGYAIAHALAANGAVVAICGRSQNGIERSVRGLEAATGQTVVGRVADVRDEADVSGFIDFAATQFGGLDILVNNAGLGIFRPVGELEVEQWRTVIDTNLTGVFLCCRAVLPHMLRAGGGSVINISSLAGRNPFAGGAAYNASKFGLNGFTEAMMLDHRKDNIRMTYVMPGSVDTEFGHSGPAASWKIAPEDIAEIVLDVLRMPARTLISRVEVRPAKPPK